MREVRLFATQKEMFHDYGGYPTGEDDICKLRGKFITIETDGRTRVSWYNEEDHDIAQCIMGLQISHLMLTHKLKRETVEYALTRLRYPSQEYPS